MLMTLRGAFLLGALCQTCGTGPDGCIAGENVPVRGLMQWTSQVRAVDDGGVSQDARGTDEPLRVAARNGSLVGECWFSEGKSENFGVHVTAACPDECPYSQTISGQRCWKACVAADQCGRFHALRNFADPKTMKCEEGCSTDPERQINGCHVCAKEGVCSRCSFMHAPNADGSKCENNFRRSWQILYVVGLLFIALVAAYSAHVCLKPTAADSKLEGATCHRGRCRPMKCVQANDGPDQWHCFPWSETSVMEEDICGVGAALYFRWLRFMMYGSLFVGIAFYAAWHLPEFNSIFFDTVSVERVVVSVNQNPGCELTGVDDMVKRLDVGDDIYFSERAGLARFSLTSVLAHLAGQAQPWPRAGNSTLSPLGLQAWRPRMRTRTRSGKRRGSGPPGTREDESHWDSEHGSASTYATRAAFVSLATYVLATIVTLEFSRRQHQFALDWVGTSGLQHRYVVLANKLPEESVSGESLKNEFQKMLDSQLSSGRDVGHVVGVSVGFEIHNLHDDIHLGISKIIEGLEAQVAVYYAESDERGDTPPITPSMRSPEDSGTDNDDDIAVLDEAGLQHIERSMSAVMRSIRHHGVFGTVDRMLAFPQKLNPQMLETSLRNLKGTGTAFVVVTSEEATEHLVNVPNPQIDGHPVSLTRLKWEPSQINWGNCRRKFNYGSIIRGVLVFSAGVVGFIVFYIPYAAHYAIIVTAEQADAGGMLPFQAFIQDMFLGALIAFGNGFIAIAIFSITDSMRFISKDKSDALVFGLFILGMFVNTLCDLISILIIATGIVVSLATTSEHMQNGYSIDAASELMSLLVPGYLVLPFVLAPFVEYFFPSFVAAQLVRSTPGLSKRQAETLLEPPEFEIRFRYPDYIHGISLSMLMCLFATQDAHRVFFVLTFCFAMVYALERHRLLRQTSLTMHPSEFLSAGFSYWFSLPTSFLGAAGFWWLAQDGVLGVHPAWAFPIVVPLHVAAYCLVLKGLRGMASTRSRSRARKQSYAEVCATLRPGAGYDYFNTNLAYICRLHLLREEDENQAMDDLGVRSCLPSVHGKAHLMKAVEGIHQKERQKVSRSPFSTLPKKRMPH